MGEFSKIEWTDHTFNPWIGCQKVSPGCDNCYAEALMDHRYGRVQWGPHGERSRTGDANWRKPRQWAKAAKQAGKRHRVFCASLADVFDNQAPDVWRGDLFALIEDTPELDWLLLTKRPENVARMIFPKWADGLPSNIWLGTTCEDQQRLEHRHRHLAQISAKVHFISYEPALGPLSLRECYPAPDWIICGGESGPKRRPMNLQWARDLRDECATARVPFFFKQVDKVLPIPADLMVREFPV
jgi:protein gp37